MSARDASAIGHTVVTADDAVRLLGPARMVLDRCAEGRPGSAEEAARMAQQIVDVIGHPATEEPPHAFVEIDRLRDLCRRAADSAAGYHLVGGVFAELREAGAGSGHHP